MRKERVVGRIKYPKTKTKRNTFNPLFCIMDQNNLNHDIKDHPLSCSRVVSAAVFPEKWLSDFWWFSETFRKFRNEIKFFDKSNSSSQDEVIVQLPPPRGTKTSKRKKLCAKQLLAFSRLTSTYLDKKGEKMIRKSVVMWEFMLSSGQKAQMNGDETLWCEQCGQTLKTHGKDSW